MKNLILILARKNSIRLKNKNLIKLGQKKLILWTIDFAKKFKKTSDILVSTDDEKILKISRKNNILAPWLRPKKYAGNKSGSIHAILHAIEWYQKNKNKINTVILLQPTSPFRSVSFTKKAIDDFGIKNKIQSYVSVSPIKNLNSKKKNKNILVNVENNLLTKKYPKKYNFFINGNLYLASVNFLKKNKSFYSENDKTQALILNAKKLSIDIDTLDDLSIAKKYL